MDKCDDEVIAIYVGNGNDDVLGRSLVVTI